MKRYKAIYSDGYARQVWAHDDHDAKKIARGWEIKQNPLSDLIDITTPNHRAVDLTTPQVQPKS